MRKAQHLAVSVLLAILVAVLGSSGCHRDKCTPFCEQMSKALHCSNPGQCKAQCTQIHESPVCRAEFKVFEACMLLQPTDKWQCDESEGTPALKDGICLPERLKVSNCLAAAPPPPPPPPTKKP